MTISANIGTAERSDIRSVTTSDDLSEKTMSFYLRLSTDELKEVAERHGVTRVIKTKLGILGKTGAFYKLEDFPILLGGLQQGIVDKELDWLKDVDTTKDEFEIVFPTGTTMKFSKS